MALFWVGAHAELRAPTPPPLAAVIPRRIVRRLDERLSMRATAAEAASSAPSPEPAGPAGGGSVLERLPPDVVGHFFSRDGYNLTRELLALRVSKTLREAVGQRPLDMIHSTLPMLRTWRDAVFPPPPPPRARANSFLHSPTRRADRNRAIMFF